MAAETNVQIQDFQTKLRKKGWNISNEGIEECMHDLGKEDKTCENVIKWAMDCNLKEFGSKILSEDVKRGQAQSVEGPLVLQIQKIRNISAPKANEESSAAPRLLKLLLTDGHTAVSALENSLIQKISLSTPPGTKIRLKGPVPLTCGFMLLEPRHVEVLGGKVEKLMLKWEANKTVSQQRTKLGMSNDDGPPLFTVFNPKAINATKKNIVKKFDPQKTETTSSNEGSSSDKQDERSKEPGAFEHNRDQRIQTAKQSRERLPNPTKSGNISSRGIDTTRSSKQGRRTVSGSDSDRRQVNINPHLNPKIPEREAFTHNQDYKKNRDRQNYNRNDEQLKRWEKGSHGQKASRGGGKNDDIDDVQSTSRPSEGTLWDFLQTKIPSSGSKAEKVRLDDFAVDDEKSGGGKGFCQPGGQRDGQHARNRYPNELQTEHGNGIQSRNISRDSNPTRNQYKNQQTSQNQIKYDQTQSGSEEMTKQRIESRVQNKRGNVKRNCGSKQNQRSSEQQQEHETTDQHGQYRKQQEDVLRDKTPYKETSDRKNKEQSQSRDDFEGARKHERPPNDVNQCKEQRERRGQISSQEKRKGKDVGRDNDRRNPQSRAVTKQCKLAESRQDNEGTKAYRNPEERAQSNQGSDDYKKDYPKCGKTDNGDSDYWKKKRSGARNKSSYENEVLRPGKQQNVQGSTVDKPEQHVDPKSHFHTGERSRNRHLSREEETYNGGRSGDERLQYIAEREHENTSERVERVVEKAEREFFKKPFENVSNTRAISKGADKGKKKNLYPQRNPECHYRGLEEKASNDVTERRGYDTRKQDVHSKKTASNQYRPSPLTYSSHPAPHKQQESAIFVPQTQFTQTRPDSFGGSVEQHGMVSQRQSRPTQEFYRPPRNAMD